MNDELEASYDWALEKFHVYLVNPVNRQHKNFGSDIEAVLKNAAHKRWPETPQCLCYQHLQKNYQTKINKYLKDKNGKHLAPADVDKELDRGIMKAFNEVNAAQIETEYERLCANFKIKYFQYSFLIEYLDKYLYPQHQKVAKVCTSKLPDYGNATTSKFECAHHRIKGFFRGSRGDLLMMFTKLSNAHSDWLQEYLAFLSRSYDQPNSHANVKSIECCDISLNRQITNYGMELFAKQLALTKSLDVKLEYAGHFQLIYGIPCCHKNRQFIEQERKFLSENFDEHWYWERDNVGSVIDIRKLIQDRRSRQPLIFEPSVPSRLNSQPRKESRILSAFEASAPGLKKRPNTLPYPVRDKETSIMDIESEVSNPNNSDDSDSMQSRKFKRYTFCTFVTKVFTDNFDNEEELQI